MSLSPRTTYIIGLKCLPIMTVKGTSSPQRKSAACRAFPLYFPSYRFYGPAVSQSVKGSCPKCILRPTYFQVGRPKRRFHSLYLRSRSERKLLGEEHEQRAGESKRSPGEGSARSLSSYSFSTVFCW